ncbi:hypothetical protein LPJ63_004833, partial [Coemansia sp. RSA 2711]
MKRVVCLAALLALSSAAKPRDINLITPSEIDDAKPNTSKVAAFMASYLATPVYEAEQPTQVDITLPSDFTLPPGETPTESETSSTETTSEQTSEAVTTETATVTVTPTTSKPT